MSDEKVTKKFIRDGQEVVITGTSEADIEAAMNPPPVVEVEGAAVEAIPPPKVTG